MYGDRVRRFRELRNMRQEDLAEQTGIVSSSISKIEHGTRKVTLEEAVRLAEVLQVTLAELAGIPEGTNGGATHAAVHRCTAKSREALHVLVSAMDELDAIATAN